MKSAIHETHECLSSYHQIARLHRMNLLQQNSLMKLRKTYNHPTSHVWDIVHQLKLFIENLTAVGSGTAQTQLFSPFGDARVSSLSANR